MNISRSGVLNQWASALNDKQPIYNKSGVNWQRIQDIMQWLQPLVGTGIALMATIIAAVLTIQITFEILYITLPVVRGFARDLEAGLGGSSLEAGRMAASFLGVSLKDAHTAVVEAETSAYSGGKATGPFKQPMAIYLRIKIKTIIIVAIALYVAFNTSMLNGIVMNFISPIMKALFGYQLA